MSSTALEDPITRNLSELLVLSHPSDNPTCYGLAQAAILFVHVSLLKLLFPQSTSCPYSQTTFYRFNLPEKVNTSKRYGSCLVFMCINLCLST